MFGVHFSLFQVQGGELSWVTWNIIESEDLLGKEEDRPTNRGSEWIESWSKTGKEAPKPVTLTKVVENIQGPSGAIL